MTFLSVLENKNMWEFIKHWNVAPLKQMAWDFFKKLLTANE